MRKLKTMLAVVKEKASVGIVVKQIPIPAPQQGEVLIKVMMCSICGTDISIYDWTKWAEGHIRPPIVIGHEVVGKIIKINSQDSLGLKIGDLVSSETHIFCDRCYQCKIGNRHICENMELFGIARNGGFAEFATIPVRTCWKNDRSVPLEWMSTQEPLGNAVHVVTKAQVEGKNVLIYGLGPTGLCAAAAASAYGANMIVGVNRGSFRRFLGKKMGASQVYQKLPKKMFGQFDVVLEMSGSSEAIREALDAVRLCGKIIAFGIPKKEVVLDFGKYIINKEITIESVFGRRIWETWYQVSNLLKSKKVNLGKIITHKFKLRDFEKALVAMKSGMAGKIVLVP